MGNSLVCCIKSENKNKEEYKNVFNEDSYDDLNSKNSDLNDLNNKDGWYKIPIINILVKTYFN